MPNQYRKITIKDCHLLASEKNGKCLSIEYINANTNLIWQCQFGHIWSATFGNIYHKNKWCAKCFGNKKLDIQYAKNIALEYGGQLLSSEYNNSLDKMRWQCKFGHIFYKKISHITFSKSWCPYCASWCSEEICRSYFERIFNTKFIKIRPQWLLNSRNNRMELDGLSETIIYDNKYLAFEHQGEQHYSKSMNMKESNYYFNMDLEQRKQDDRDKIKLCNENNVVLIPIPQLIKMTKLENLNDFIKNQCSKNKMDTNLFNFNVDIDIAKFYKIKKETNE